MNIVLVFFGGGLGAVFRYLVGIGWVRLNGPGQPYLATAIINVTGSLLMGLLIGALVRTTGGVNERWRLLFGVGVLGGYTTFSSFSLEAVMMIERKAYGVAAAYICGSVVLGVLGLILGLMIMRRMPL
jgi:fluoride exporter